MHRVLPEEQPPPPEIQSVLFLFFIKNYLPPCHSMDEKRGNTWLSQRVAIICYHEVWLHIRKPSHSRRWVSFLTLLRVKQSNCFGSSMRSSGSQPSSVSPSMCFPSSRSLGVGWRALIWAAGGRKEERRGTLIFQEGRRGDYLEEGEVDHQEWSRNAWLWKSKDGGHWGQS